ncbi:MAG: phosphonoacetaldehyde hydrolase [Anaerolineaceae bacterium]|nr:phosphonoacetaldehyde hydrolase [Anaerolineaceae bacterium]
MEFIFRRTYRGPIKAVVLDWAGTAVDFGSFAPTAVFLRLFESRAVKISAADARSGMGLMKKDHLRTILARPSVAEAWKSAHGAPASDKDVDDLFESFVPMQLAVLKEYADPIPGLLDVIKELRGHGIKIGSTTGYIRSMMDILAPEASKNGYDPDCIVCPDDVPAGRPYPWMCYQNAIQMGVYPMRAMVKVGDTLPDIEEGLNAGMWTVGLSLTGNLMGLSEAEVKALPAEKRKAACSNIQSQLSQAGAHMIIDGIWDLPDALSEIEKRISAGERVD